ncbi:helix-turn-helix domain-containing protein [Pontibacter silvestris]|uniref:Helix-turn-helix domain-containing protein n=1 Tax=Pontibacter silvestris TaxID=2305183 RepID=A0ABW4X4H3_9BACT|nr:AraC family transcriptional regulator [Pontibacter silvestris]MCC9138349.1 AraC family transcriptional regulator [Pontibacter silvestris]
MIEEKISDELNKTLIYIRNLNNCPPSYLNDPSRKEFFEVVWLKDEYALHAVKEGDHSEKGHWIYLLPPYRVHQLNKAGKKGVLLSFKRELLDEDAKEFSLDVFKIFNIHGEYSCIKVSEELSDQLCKVYDLMEEEYQKEDSSILIIKSLLKAFLLNIIRIKEHEFTTQDVNQKRVYEFMLLLEEHYLHIRNIDFYADKIGISSKRLNQILKEKLQKTGVQLIHDRIILEAKRQLIHSENTIKEIAYQLEFTDHPYFTRFFKQHTGQTPDEFKKQAQLHIASKANTLV